MNNKYFIWLFGGLVTIYMNLFHSYDLLIASGVGLSVIVFLLLVDGLGSRIPMREVIALIVFLQLFIGPLVSYRYFDNNAHYKMYVSESIYMAYALPAIFSFLIGLFIPLGSKALSSISVKKLLESSGGWQMDKAYVMIAVGYFSIFVSPYVPGSVGFIFYLLSLLRFIGGFMLVFSNKKYKTVLLILIFGHFAYEIIKGGVFYDLFVWVFFLYMLLEIKLKSPFIRKLTFIFMGALTVYFVQIIKGDYRQQAWTDDESIDKTEVFFDVASKQIESKTNFGEKSNLNRVISRLNTGWILSKVIEHTPKREPFTNGETLQNDLVNVFLPRFLFPNKAQTGGKQNQQKFARFTGRRLIGSTTMRIGSFADAYVNFGPIGGWVVLLLLGLLFNFIIYFLIKLSLKNPIYSLWIPFIFAYAVRMSDFQVILNYTFKSFVFVVFLNAVFFSAPAVRKRKTLYKNNQDEAEASVETSSSS